MTAIFSLSDHPICPVMIGDARIAAECADEMLQRGIYVIGFSYPVRACLPTMLRTNSTVVLCSGCPEGQGPYPCTDQRCSYRRADRSRCGCIYRCWKGEGSDLDSSARLSNVVHDTGACDDEQRPSHKWPILFLLYS